METNQWFQYPSHILKKWIKKIKMACSLNLIFRIFIQTSRRNCITCRNAIERNKKNDKKLRRENLNFYWWNETKLLIILQCEYCSPKSNVSININDGAITWSAWKQLEINWRYYRELGKPRSIWSAMHIKYKVKCIWW